MRLPRGPGPTWIAIAAIGAAVLAATRPTAVADAAEAPFKPHYVSLRHATVNARSGPGTRYPISWVYKRAGLPVEALAEFDNWYKVRDVEGDEGWIHRRLLSAERTGLIAGETRTVRSDPQENSAVVLYAEPGVVARIIACKAQWCRLNLQGRKGWLPREHLWGVYPEENFN